MVRLRKRRRRHSTTARTTAHRGIRKEFNVASRVAQMAEGVWPKALKWLLEAVLAVVFIGVLLWFANRNRSSVNNAVNTATTASSNGVSHPSNAATNSGGSLGAFVKASIPGGVDLNIPENGMESKLLVFIQDPTAQPSRETWFEFDRLNFDTGGDHLQLSSQEQLDREDSEGLREGPRANRRLYGHPRRRGGQLEAISRTR